MQPEPRLLSVATAVPRYVLRQDEVRERAKLIFASENRDIGRLEPVYGNAGIETRYSCVPIDWYAEPTGWKARNALYLENAVALLAGATERCLARARLRVEDIDAIVVASTSGLATPSLDARLMEVLPFRRDVQRLPIFGLGCAGGVIGLARAAALAKATPGLRVLFLVTELCGLTFRVGDKSKSNVIATALFGDGAAAALLAAEEAADAPALVAWGEHTWPASLDVMGWRIEDDGFGVLFSRDIPALVTQHLRAATDAFLKRFGWTLAEIDDFICHPGGTKVVDALEHAFGLLPGAMRASRDILHDYGNMSAATVMFVLERRLAEGLGARSLLSALGPGFTAAFLVIEAQ
jgi:alkylresorcinol/alkylpyrone synthase